MPAYLVLIGGFYAIYQSFFSVSLSLFFTGIISILAGIAYLIIVSVIELFKKDKELNLSHFRSEGFQIVSCNNCEQENLLVDQYCIHCGEKLESEEDGKVQEEH